MLIIDPEECIDCGACEPECPVEAIFPEDALPDKWEPFVKINYAFPEGAAAVDPLVQQYADEQRRPQRAAGVGRGPRSEGEARRRRAADPRAPAQGKHSDNRPRGAPTPCCHCIERRVSGECRLRAGPARRSVRERTLPRSQACGGGRHDEADRRHRPVAPRLERAVELGGPLGQPVDHRLTPLRRRVVRDRRARRHRRPSGRA